MESFVHSDASQLTPEQLLCGRDQVLEQMRWSRQYTMQILDSIPHQLWYQRPEPAPTHVAWQVGHLAVSQYGLMLFRQRGRAPGDLDLMPGWLRRQFGRGTKASASSQDMPSPDELLRRLDTIHQQALQEVAALPAKVLAEPTDMPFTAYPIKLGALLFCPLHESLHAGQIGLLRRLHGLEPIR